MKKSLGKLGVAVGLAGIFSGTGCMRDSLSPVTAQEASQQPALLVVCDSMSSHKSQETEMQLPVTFDLDPDAIVITSAANLSLAGSVLDVACQFSILHDAERKGLDIACAYKTAANIPVLTTGTRYGEINMPEENTARNGPSLKLHGNKTAVIMRPESSESAHPKTGEDLNSRFDISSGMTCMVDAVGTGRVAAPAAPSAPTPALPSVKI